MDRLTQCESVMRGFALLLIILPSLVQAEDKAPMSARKLLQSSRPLVIAHRGYSSLAPENTLVAFDRALQAKADMIELDYFHSADGVPVSFHDKKLGRTTDAVRHGLNAESSVADHSWETLQKLDAGRWFAPEFAGQRIPSLEQSITRIQSGSMTLIERKGGDAKTCVQLLRELGMLEQVIVQAFDWNYLRSCRQLAPELTLVALGSDPITPSDWNELKKLNVQGIGWNQKHLNAAIIRNAHDRGWRVLSYTVNDEPTAQRLLNAGIDGLITDKPELIQQVLRKRQLSDPRR